MPEKKRLVAEEVVAIFPLLMRNVSADIRCFGGGLAHAHFRLLGVLSNRGYSLTELAEMQAVTLATMSNTITTLVERGLVTRTTAQDDRRMAQVKLTPLGLETLRKVQLHLVDRVVSLLGDLHPDELEQLQQGMEVLMKVLKVGVQNPPVNPSRCMDLGNGQGESAGQN